jgi:hypothetical protein
VEWSNRTAFPGVREGRGRDGGIQDRCEGITYYRPRSFEGTRRDVINTSGRAGFKYGNTVQVKSYLHTRARLVTGSL